MKAAPARRRPGPGRVRSGLCAAAIALSFSAIHVQSAEEPTLHAVGPPLTRVAEKIADPNWLVAWLWKPSALRPGTAMPDFEMTAEQAQAIARYLYPPSGRTQGALANVRGDAKRGELLFVRRGCRGCHGIAPGERGASSRVPNLADAGSKLRPEWIVAWLRSPRTYDPRTPMPRLALSDSEILDLAAFLLALRSAAPPPENAPRYDARASEFRGRDLVREFECAKCHALPDAPPPPAPLVLRPSGNDDRAAVLEDGRKLVAFYNCRGCHRIEGEGGYIARYLERQTFAPPTLDGEGARVQTSWLVRFLLQPIRLRPWLEIQMPDYGLSLAEAEALARYFAAVSGVEPRDEPIPPASPELLDRGLRRIAHYKCAQCHVSLDRIPPGVDPENLSIDFLLAQRRLRPSWVREFLARPKAIVGKQSRMPDVFFTIDGIPKVEHPERDIEAITAYLLHMQQPLDAALAALRKADESEKANSQIDWTQYPY